MRFTTPVSLPETRSLLPLGKPVVALGSCFAERIGKRLSDALFPTTTNPTGIHYNPVSLARSLRLVADSAELFLHQGLWRSLDHHSELARSTPEQSLQALKQSDRLRLVGLQNAKVMLLTLGTAQVFQLRNSGRVVANCHRLDGQLFRRRRLSIEEAVTALSHPLNQWLESDGRRQVIITVSPVRYLRDGLVENNRGKAVLLLACEELAANHPRIEYFPAYEIVIDELRDYRFYDAGMAQPSDQAVDYVWEAFRRTYLDRADDEVLGMVQKARALAAHRHGPRTDTGKLGTRGMELLRRIEKARPGVDTSALKSVFNGWLSPP